MTTNTDYGGTATTKDFEMKWKVPADRSSLYVPSCLSHVPHTHMKAVLLELPGVAGTPKSAGGPEEACFGLAEMEG